ncbi:unnamed protein product, partial [Prorocentrum cordatum]
GPLRELAAAHAGGAAWQPRQPQLARALASYPAASFSVPGHGAPAWSAGAGAAGADALAFAGLSSASRSTSGASGQEAAAPRERGGVPAGRVHVSSRQASRDLQTRAGGGSRGRPQALQGQAPAQPSPQQLAHELQERLGGQLGPPRPREAGAHPQAQDALQMPHGLGSPPAAEKRPQHERRPAPPPPRDARQQRGTSAQQAANVRRGRSEASQVQTLESLPEAGPRTIPTTSTTTPAGWSAPWTAAVPEGSSRRPAPRELREPAQGRAHDGDGLGVEVRQHGQPEQRG